MTNGIDQLRADVRDALDQRNAEHETEFTLQLYEADLLDLASGYVPPSVKAMCLAALDWASEDERRANRPARRKEK